MRFAYELRVFAPCSAMSTTSRVCGMRKSIYERTQTAAQLLEELTELRLDFAIRARTGSPV
jgi:hypothetical protein